ncbi:MAG: type II and III secretion system protein [Fuerstiella sp.]|jgi:type II secretory pathway component GspD/PulD (secretin)|nr:type II and III secretion system protein [Fuerstiella sp.]MCP4505641.1 type II and III secretion system protein [Fuerstiella sp.]MDG2131099.1 hypothetical protein [Fuerstiella sp.]
MSTSTGEDHIADELKLLTVNNMPAMLQFGQQLTVPEGLQRAGSRTITHSNHHKKAGTLLKATP